MAWGLAAVAAIALAWALFVVGRRRFDWEPAAVMPDVTHAEGSRRTVRFAAVDGTEIEGWMYQPAAADGAPVIVMAPGLTGTKEGPLETFAWAFVAAGYGVLAFDFRCFGGSGGEPRHWLDPLRQIEDYRSAIVWLRANGHARIVLWGTSFSGTAAIGAADDEIAAVIAQVPYLGGAPVHPPSGLQIAGYVALSICESVGDALARLVGARLKPAYITTYGRPGERTFAMSEQNPPRRGTADNPHPFWRAIPAPMRGGWENMMLVRGLRNLEAFQAKDRLPSLTCPVLLIGAERDDMVSFAVLRDAAKTLP